jgi:hypothetical protein
MTWSHLPRLTVPAAAWPAAHQIRNIMTVLFDAVF